MTRHERRLGPLPTAHLCAPEGWINDPNGLVVDGGTWNAFHQWHPARDVWGPMHWGRATSTDLLDWQHHGVALAPEASGTAYSGSIVIDHEGTAGAGAGAWIAVHTRHDDRSDDGGTVTESQYLAISTDRGRTWQTESEPVLTSSLVDFRDPKVFGHDGHWVMVLAAGDHVQVHLSSDLRRWTLADEIALPPSPTAWECPDLVSIDGQWVLIACTSSLHGHGGTMAIRGRFDQGRFSPTSPMQMLDDGPDFYAAQSFHGLTDRVVVMAWIGSWSTAHDLPSTGTRGVLSLPRELALDARGRVTSRPAREVRGRGTLMTGRGPTTVSLRGDHGARATATITAHSVVVERSVPGTPTLSWEREVARRADESWYVAADAGSFEVFVDDGASCMTLALGTDTGWTLES